MFRRNCQNASKFLDWNRDSRSDFRIDVVYVSNSDTLLVLLYIFPHLRCRFRTFTSLLLLLFAFWSSCTWHSSIIAPYAIGQPRSISLLSSKIICKQPRWSEHLFFCNKSLSVVRFTEASYQMWAFSKHRSTNLENNVYPFPGFIQCKIVDL